MNFIDGDDLHPVANVEKMRRGEPLNDDDRAPWLGIVGRTLASADAPLAIACSALKRAYRDTIRTEANSVAFIHLHAPKSILASRVAARKNHFMPPALLDSQFEALETLQPDEDGLVVDINQPLAGVVADAKAYIMRAVK
jgi:carbohydrate kinase (thermoresistant glucokinase family)